MKSNYLFFLSMLSLLICFSCQQEKSKEGNSVNFDWLIGEWLRSNEEDGKMTYEYWQKISQKEYKGLGCTVFAGDTTFKEDLKIHRSEGAWWLKVTGLDNSPVSFRIVSVKKNGLNAENPDNEFPKFIKYRLIDDQLKAFVSDDNNKIEFVFDRM